MEKAATDAAFRKIQANRSGDPLPPG